MATGDQPLDIVADGAPVVQAVAAGEVVCRDDLGVTCRRWNCAEERAAAAVADLAAQLSVDSPEAAFATRVLAG